MLDIEVIDAEVVRSARLIGVAGLINSGKDTVGEIINALSMTNKGPEFVVKKFAGKLKQTASILTGIPASRFEDHAFKNSEMPSEWDYLDQSGRYKTLKPMTYRLFLQKLGTEAMRNGLHKDIWVNSLFADYKSKWYPTNENTEADEVSLEKRYPSWVITDMRFPNEFDAVKKRGGITIYVHRPDTHSFQSMIKAHESETALDNHNFDYAVINNGTIEDLVKKVRDILINERII